MLKQPLSCMKKSPSCMKNEPLGFTFPAPGKKIFGGTPYFTAEVNLLNINPQLP